MLEKILTELRNNARLRWGVALILALLWLYGLMLLNEAQQAQQQQYRAGAQTLARLEAQLTQAEWLTRVESAKTLVVQLESQLWQAPTSGLAQAAFQDWLNATLQKAGAVRPIITVTVVDEITAASAYPETAAGSTPPDLWKLTAKLGFAFEAEKLLTVLSEIESNDKRIIIGSLHIRKQPTAHVEMELHAYFQKQVRPLVPL